MKAKVWKLKSTGEVVVPLKLKNHTDRGRTLCIFKHDVKTRAGNWGHCQLVNNDNLIEA